MSNSAAIGTMGLGVAERVLVPRLISGTHVLRLPDGRLRIEGAGAAVTLPLLPTGLTSGLASLEGNKATLEQIYDQVDGIDGPAMGSMLFAHLARLSTQGLLTHHLVVDNEEYASIEPTGMRYRLLVQPLSASRPLRLSRFGTIRRDGDGMVVQSALGHGAVRITNASLMAITGALAAAQTPETLAAISDRLGVGPDTIAGLIALLSNARVFEDPAERDNEDLRLWNAHDLTFHMSSRYGRFGGDFGGNFRHIGEMDPAPAVRPLPDGERVPLPVPVLDDMLRNDPPFQEVVETRQSIYTYGPNPITIEDLGEFLYRVGRVRWIGHQHVSSLLTGEEGQMEVSSRPVPAGGRGYELELYLTIAECHGLAPGMYHYDPAGHQLTRMRPADKLTEQMLTYASIASPGAEPQVLITLAARFRRMMWKYDRLAYAATLKHVGVMIQQMYLAATTMHLAPSALGSGNIETFAAATGNDPLVESSVGEFILGSSSRTPRPHRPRMLYPERDV